MYSKQDTTATRAQKGQASIVESRGRLSIRFPRELFNGKMKFLALGLADTSEGYTEAERKLKAVQADIDLGVFDLTLEKYQRQSKKAEYITAVTELHPSLTLTDLWNKYVAYKRPNLKETTLWYMETTVTRNLIASGITSPYKALELRKWLLNDTTESMTKRILLHVNAAFKWGIKHKLLKAPNPYEGINQDLKHNYEKSGKPNAFTPSEVAAVIDAFRNHIGNWNGRGYTGFAYNYYLPFVRFLLLTGCRPAEAVGLRWGDVSTDCRKIIFNGGISYTGNRMIRTVGSKNNKKREFPCNGELQTMLQAIRPRVVDDEALVFPSPKGKAINYNNFSKKAWDKIVDPIKPGTTPYNCRDTFITQQISKGVAPALVAKWVDNSVAIIERDYLDSESLGHIMPL